tara:strand:- start:52 stop:288 length:237 start_codon:yes stop_codon:yes gene_type:complete
MTLNEFVPQGGMGVFARALKVHPRTLQRAMKGQRISAMVALRIEEATEGMVTLEELGFDENESKALRVFRKVTEGVAA